MWTLLAAAGPDDRLDAGGDGGHRVPSARRNGAAVVAAPGPSRPDGGEAGDSVRVYLHPGAIAVAAMGLDRAQSQFPLATAPVFASLEEAVPACAGRVGFLVDVRTPPSRNGCGRAVYFVETLRT